jgi:RNA polymerase sigma-70 factor (ECF subfamily)
MDIERLYDEHAQALFGFLLSVIRDEADTRDVLQEVFVKLARQPESLDGVRDPRSFLIRMAHNAAVDLIRRRGARQQAGEALAEGSPELFARSEDPDERAFSEALTRGLGELPAEQRAVVHLKLWEGLTFEQIAATLNIPPNTAASRYRYGIDKLRTLLRPLYDEIK